MTKVVAKFIGAIRKVIKKKTVVISSLAIMLACAAFIIVVAVSEHRERVRLEELIGKPRVTIWGYGTAAGEIKGKTAFMVLKNTEGDYHCYFQEKYVPYFIANMNRYFEANKAMGRVHLLKVSGVLTNHETALQGYKQLELCQIEGWE